jgi:phosphoribosyl 1,2-cyclic phosphate phosphodiesterase
MRITVLGTGTSTGIPAIGCRCDVCRSDRPENQRLRCSLYVEDDGGAKFLVDCSTDLRQQALRYGIARVDAVLMTHDHGDHINGIDDLRAYNFLQDREIDVYGDAGVIKTFRSRFAYCFNPPQLGGGVPRLSLHPIEAGQRLHLEGLEVTPIRIKHGKLDILGYRLGSAFAYLTDCSGVPDESMPLLEGVRVLVVGALRPTPHPTHFSLDEALALSRRVAPEQTWFTHITCRMEHFATNASLPPDARLLHDGQVIEIPAGT